MGAQDRIFVDYRESNDYRQVIIKDNRGEHIRGLQGFDPYANVDGLEHAVNTTIADHNIARARFIWNQILVPYKHLIKGKVESSTTQSYLKSMCFDLTSPLGSSIEIGPWLPDSLGCFHNVKDMSIADLAEGFIKDKDLAEIIGMSIPDDDPVDVLARELGLPVEIVRDLKNNPDLAQDFIASIKKIIDQASRKSYEKRNDEENEPEFPKNWISDPDRRADVVSSDITDAPDKTYEKRERSVRVSDNALNKDAYLKNYYTNSNDEMVCQLCKKIMPFKKRNGEYYFEAVELLTKELISKESESLYLALCPTCAAKYKEYIKLDSNKIQTLIKQIRSSDIEEIAIETDRSETLKFNPPHYLDIRTILSELLEPNQ